MIRFKNYKVLRIYPLSHLKQVISQHDGRKKQRRNPRGKSCRHWNRRNAAFNCAQRAYACVPLPLRIRTPTRISLESALQSPHPDRTPSPARSFPPPSAHNLYQLVVQPIVKTTIGQRDTSGNTLDIVAINGISFSDIKSKLWELFGSRVKGRAVKKDGAWSVEVPTIEGWSKVMQFKAKRHVVESSKSEHAWHLWLQAMLGETVKLLVYEYGVAVGKAQDLQEFTTACIRPPETDRSEATAEVSLQEVVTQLQQQWGRSFEAEAVVWRLWANHLTRNLNRLTWNASIQQPPPDFIAHLLRTSDTRHEQHLNSITRSTNLALDCVDGVIADYRQLREDYEAMGRRMDAHEQSLARRRSIITAFQRDVLPPRNVVDPLARLENINDVDHQE